jgi:uncharacterized protein (UPF0548 family)
MFLLTKPNGPEIDKFLANCREQDFSYSELGATQQIAPRGYNVDNNRILLGTDQQAFERAKSALRAWKMFSLGWVELCYPDSPVAAGVTVAVLVSHFGFYSLNGARVVYTVDEPGRFGFAYGTLTEHGEIGEERFSVDFLPEKEEVWYDLYAFSRPGSLLARLGYPVSRYLQKQFARDSLMAMRRAVSGADAMIE